VADDSPIIKEIFIDASPEETFPFLAESEKYVRWMGLAAELEARPGGAFRVDPNGRDVIVGRILEISPPNRIVFTWGWEEPGHAVPGGSTTVEITLVPQGAGTLLRLVHRGLSGAERQKHVLGWPHYLARLTIAAGGGDPGPDPLAVTSHKHG
jgi:uncharacterized protein YndB with AHSA1/START domain